MQDPIDRLNRALSGRYRIEREIGVGGMATVYLATDERHSRKVALKVLKPELSALLGAERFLAEIKTTANLQHPNILPLFDSGEADGLLYYVMPFVDGESLRERLERERDLPLDETIKITSDVAEALQAAHEEGVIHRDIKPANILLSRGRALVADFGIARAAEVSEDSRLTRAGASLGTAGYMSPEQASGSESVDHRTDIYSLASMVYEMLVGETPFTGPTVLAVVAKQVTESAPPVTQLRPDLPATLERALTMALDREPGGRFDTVALFAAALAERDPAPLPGSEPRVKTVVVIPFVNRSGDADNEYFSDGLTEEVISDLTRISGLRVISRNSAMALKGTTKDTATLARELGVTHMVTGSVRRAGKALRMTAELVEARTDTPIWTDKYSGTVEDVFAIQEEISQQIVSALHVKLTATEEKTVVDRPIGDVVAHDCYLRARQRMYDWTPEAQQEALSLVEEAMEIVGEVPLLLATAGQIHWSMVNTDMVPAEVGLERASEFVERALAIDPQFYLAIFVRGLIAGIRGQSELALKDLYHANRLRPGDANILVELCRYSNVSGLRSHWKYVEELVRLDPLTPVTPLVVSTYRWINGPQEEAAPPARRSIEMAKGASMLHLVAAWQIAEAGFKDEAVLILENTGDQIGDNMYGRLIRFFRAALRGEKDAAVGFLAPEMEGAIRNEFVCRFMAEAHGLLGRREDGLRWLRRAIEFGLVHYPSHSQGGRFLEGLRGEPEFQSMMDELKPRWEAIVAWEAAQTDH